MMQIHVKCLPFGRCHRCGFSWSANSSGLDAHFEVIQEIELLEAAGSAVH